MGSFIWHVLKEVCFWTWLGCLWRRGMSVAALACGTKTNIAVTACAVKLVKVWVE